MRKTPDNVVYSEERGYYASLLPYASNVGAPVIKTNDLDNWKVSGIHKVNRQMAFKFQELKDEYNKLVKEFEWNELVYNAKFSFEPVVGETYYLYRNKEKMAFLSLIAPSEWNQEYIGTTLLNSDRKWVLLEAR